jgi:MFS family permease
MNTFLLEGHMQEEVGFIELLRVNPIFRRYWIANSISMLGEWFNTVAIFVLIESISTSALAISGVIVLRMFALAIPQLFTGVIADRYSRKMLLVMSNIASALVLIPLFFLRGAQDLWIIYAVSAGLMFLHAIYIPAENAVMPTITAKNELLTANALNSGTWSASLAIGSGLGGIVVAAWGVNIAFAINMLSFIIAALLLLAIDIPKTKAKKRVGRWWESSLLEVKEGWSIILSTPPVRRIITAKAMWGLFGGGLVYMLILIGAEGGFGNIATGIGMLFAARGIGTGLGPILAKYAFTNREIWPQLLGWLVSIAGLGYCLIGFLEWTPWIAIIVISAHAASGVNWVLSTVLLQERSEDEWRGRLFATDFLLLTTILGLSTMAAGLLVEFGPLTLREAVLLFAVLQTFSGLIWTFLVSPGEKKLRKENVVNSQSN